VTRRSNANSLSGKRPDLGIECGAEGAIARRQDSIGLPAAIDILLHLHGATAGGSHCSRKCQELANGHGAVVGRVGHALRGRGVTEALVEMVSVCVVPSPTALIGATTTS
jgi:hypothetical protein